MSDRDPPLASRTAVSPAPGAAMLLAPLLCVSALQLALTIGFICYCQNQWLQKDVNGSSEEFLQNLSLFSNFNGSPYKLSEVEIQKVFESCLQSLQGLKQPLNQVNVKGVMTQIEEEQGNSPDFLAVHRAADKHRRKGAVSNHKRKNSKRLAPCAHLTIKKPIQNSSDLETSFPGLKGKLIASWEEKVGVAHLREMHYSQGSLTIKHEGLYYIYAQILFRYHADYPMSTREYQLIQYVYRKMAKYPTPTLILRGASTWCSGNHNLYSVYQGGVFKLYHGDKIFVTVSNISLVDVDEASSYLGAFKLD
ncbi:tumor necrosis factor ligand superfamily member 10 [Heterodontus francisci]|uniref:tumor necrosis factor ligand superfamily member 10 n=1 Tax=Heterodontus francisci TaxID=7792 RepID=UPI00355AF782